MRQKVANYKRLRELVNEWVELAIELEKPSGGGEAGPWRLIAISCRKILLPCGRWWPVYSRSWTPRSAAATVAAHGGAVAALALRPKRERVNENQLFLYAVGIIGTGQEILPLPEESETETTNTPTSRTWPATLTETLERRRVSTISENRNGNVPSARESCSTSARRSVSGWNTCRLRCM